jgi:hypothetical protein
MNNSFNRMPVKKTAMHEPHRTRGIACKTPGALPSICHPEELERRRISGRFLLAFLQDGAGSTGWLLQLST